MSLQVMSRVLRLFFSSSTYSPIQNCTILNSKNAFRPTNIPQCYYSMKPSSNIVVEIDPETGEKKKKKTIAIPKITLLHDQEINILTLEQAQKLAKRRDLKLVKVVDLDTKTQRAVYKLMTGQEYYEQDLKQREKRKEDKLKSSIKGEKVLLLSPNITEHDLMVHINKIIKWIKKQYEVFVVINGSSGTTQKCEKIYSFIEEKLSSEARLLQKRQKGNDLKFQILPPKRNNHIYASGNPHDPNRQSEEDTNKKPL